MRNRALLPAGRIVAILAAGLLLSQTSCLIPVRRAPGAEGVVVDAQTGDPVADAIVVVRFDAWYDDVLPDRDLLGHREARTDAEGNFRGGPLIRPGLTAWPLMRTEARVVGVMADGYRCPPPQAVHGRTLLRVAQALDLDDRRDSCRPVAANRREASAYMEAWRDLFPARASRESREQQRELERLLTARSVFGFGENCVGPVLDLALDPSGQRAALVVGGRENPEILALELDGDGVRHSEVVSQARLGRHERLAWKGPAELVLWEPATQTQRMLSGSIFGSERFEVLWTAPAAEPVSGGREFDPSSLGRTLDPADLNDEGDARWMGRSFRLRRNVDAGTGLPLEQLAVTRPDGSTYAVDLPGETCGPRGRFGRPHYRITADGGSGLDLRFVDGGCHAVRIDLESGAWARLDGTSDAARCRQVRSVPAQHMTAALRGYMREVSDALENERADPETAFAIHVDAQGETLAITRDLLGAKHTVRVPSFPLVTPLKRIEVTPAGGRTPVPEHGSSPPLEPSPL
jgi:hypothetical protein